MADILQVVDDYYHTEMRLLLQGVLERSVSDESKNSLNAGLKLSVIPAVREKSSCENNAWQVFFL